MADEHFFPAGDFASGLGAAPFFGSSGPYAPAPPPMPLDVAACAAAMAPFGMMLPPWAAELHLPADSAAETTTTAGHFDSALSSLVSSPAHASGGGAGSDDVAAIGDLIGRLGSICNTAASASNSCYSTPLSSPPRGTSAAAAMAFRGYHPGVQLAPPLETTGRLSRVASSKSLGAGAAASAPALENAEAAETTSTKAAAGEPAKGAARKRKGKASSSAATAAATNGSPKRPKVAGEDDDKCGEDAAAGDAAEEKKPEPVKDYIHVRARRGQATDSHSLAERVRREKISERMKLLQSLVPGCNKITGKALMLDEIINYVQSLQRQVEFLSMKLATMNPELEVDAQYLPSDKDTMMHHVDAAAFSYGGDVFAGGALPPTTMESCTSTAFHPGTSAFGWAHDHDLQSIVHHDMTNGHGQQSHNHH
ncbi:hypothetical protein EJB05_37214, partial [Eragrostis curvula]